MSDDTPRFMKDLERKMKEETSEDTPPDILTLLEVKAIGDKCRSVDETGEARTPPSPDEILRLCGSHERLRARHDTLVADFSDLTTERRSRMEDPKVQHIRKQHIRKMNGGQDVERKSDISVRYLLREMKAACPYECHVRVEATACEGTVNLVWIFWPVEESGVRALGEKSSTVKLFFSLIEYGRLGFQYLEAVTDRAHQEIEEVAKEMRH